MRGNDPRMSESGEYGLPEGIVGLTGPISRPAPGTVPLRGDLAHIALAHRYLAAHYVIPEIREIGPGGAQFLLQPNDTSDAGAALEPGAQVEVLDVAGDWIWACTGPDGPSGYFRTSALAA